MVMQLQLLMSDTWIPREHVKEPKTVLVKVATYTSPFLFNVVNGPGLTRSVVVKRLISNIWNLISTSTRRPAGATCSRKVTFSPVRARVRAKVRVRVRVRPSAFTG